MHLALSRPVLVSVISLLAGTVIPATVQAAQPQIVTGYISLALKSDGTVWAWGDSCKTTYARQVNDISGAPVRNAIGIATNHLGGILVINADGSVSRANGCATGWDKLTTSTGALVTGVVQASGFGSNAVVKSDGTVWTFGGNAYGQLGYGTTGSPTTTAAQVRTSSTAFLTGVKAVRSAEIFSLAVKFDGSLWAWGYNWRNPAGSTFAAPVVDSKGVAVTNVRSIGSSWGSAFHFIRNDGSLWAMDARTGTVTAVQGANKLPLTGVQAVDGTYKYGCNGGVAVKDDGSLLEWVCGSTGGLTSPAFAVKTTAGAAMTDVRAVAGAVYNTLALRQDGTVWQWGTGGAGMSTPVGGFAASKVVDAAGTALNLTAPASCNIP